MGRGPREDDGDKSAWEKWYREEGTLRQLHILQEAEQKAKEEQATEGEKAHLLEIPRGKYKELDQLDDILESGGKLAEQQRKLLIRFPMIGLVVIMALFAYVGYEGAMAVIGDGLNPGQFMSQHTFLIQVICVLLCGVFVMLLAALQPTFVRAIVYVNRGLVVYFLGCGLVICPFVMPLIMPDSTGRASQLWLVCGIVKCMGFISLLTWALYTKTPRECLYYMEWGCMGVAVGIGFFAGGSTYCVMLDMDASQIPANFMRNWIITGLLVCFEGYLCISGFPRAAGKSLLRSMPGLGSDDASYEHQSLAATIAIMIGADSGFRKIMESAMGDFYAVSMEDVAWDEFEKNYPDPNCFKKARKVAFKEVDFFISHSWSDDPKAKWDAVQNMRRRFKLENEREPLVWFDKYCIDQNAIDQSIRRLPIFVVASKKFFVLFGESYASRCWCMLEMFVFASVQKCGLFGEGDLIIEPLGKNKEAMAKLENSFTMHQTDCYREVDKQTIFGIIETAAEGETAFNKLVRSMAGIARNRMQ